MVPESEMEFLQRTVRFMVRAMCEVQLKGRQMARGLMLILGLCESINQLAMANRFH